MSTDPLRNFIKTMDDARFSLVERSASQKLEIIRNLARAAPPAPIASASEAAPVAYWWNDLGKGGSVVKAIGFDAPPYISTSALNPLYTHPAAAQPSRAEVLEEACAAIKAEDDRQADNDYVLDSDDCIRVIRALKNKP